VTLRRISLALVGAGKMGGALLAGWLDMGFDPAGLVAFDPAPSKEIASLCAKAGVRLNPPRAGEPPPQALVIALKPQAFDAVAAEFADLAGADTLALSIMAGKTIADIAARLPGAGAIVRAMPNTPAAVRRGIAGAAAGPSVSSEQRQLADDLLSAVGRVEWLADEALLNAVTAVSGSGPAYVFLLAECLAAAGVEAGLPADVALRLARTTIEGAGELMGQSPQISPAELRKNVTSPGGTTAAALAVLTAPDGLAQLMRRAVAAAQRRGEELAG
jgi:pyrroline-5-carboxylate reductase